MRIVLAEERNGQRRPERAFDRATVKIGRDPSECQVIFDQAEWPMVSRKHAEFRLKDGGCLLVDTNSSFGTFLNGQRITEPVEVQAGSRVQFGAGGPVMLVVSIDVAQPARAGAPAASFSEMETYRDMGGSVQALEQAKITPTAPQQRPAPPPPAQVAPPAPPAPAQPATIEVVSSMTGKLERIQINKEVMRLGRDPGMDVEIEAAAAVVSRRHAEIRRHNGQFVLVDLGSFNGTLLNDQRITTPMPLHHGDRIQLGMGGPILRFLDPAHPAPAGAHGAGQLSPAQALVSGPPAEAPGMHTMVVPSGSGPLPPQASAGAGSQPQLLLQRQFAGRPHLTVGRAPDSDIRLDGLQISNRHARLLNAGGQVFIEDIGSTNGVYVNGARISGRRPIQARDVVQVGPFLIHADAQHGVAVFDTRSKTRIDVIDITKIVPNRSGGGTIKLLDDVDLTIQPNEFVGLLGPSGAGKSTLMDSLNGMRPATKGQVLINNLDLYQHLDSLKQSIGYVPQDDIIHRELTVYRTLYYVARLRLSRDVSAQEIDQIVNEVMDVTGLSERRDVPVGQLSGGQRKRVSIAVELITKPSVIFLDEPTSGLDPATEGKIMELFRQIAESGRTVVLTTHAMENVKLFDKVAIVLRGRLIFYGTPQEALNHMEAESFKDLYEKLEEPIEERLADLPPLPPASTEEQKRAYELQKELITEEVAENWRQRFLRTEQYQRNVVRPLKGLRSDAQHAVPPKRRPTVTDALRQWATLVARYKGVLARDKLNLLILFGQAPIIAFLIYIVAGEQSPRVFPYFMMGLVPIWFGTTVAAREIIRERAVYQRERMVNLGLLPYVGSKLFVLSLIVSLQCLMLFVTIKFFDLTGLMKLPGYLGGIPQLLVMILTGIVGIAMGLFISAVVKTSEMATSLVPLVLIPQILFSGLVVMPEGISKVVGVTMPVTWSFDEMKRLSMLETLSEEGSDPDGPHKGRGLHKYIEDLNDQNIKKAQNEMEAYKYKAEDDLALFEEKMNNYLRDVRTKPTLKPPKPPKLGPAPKVPEVTKIPEDLSDYVDFLHPWGHIILNPLVLLLMFFGLTGATIAALRAQDIG